MIVKQVQNAFQILEFFEQHRRPATPAEIADAFAWPRSSTLNLIETLTSIGLLYEPKFRAGYYPTGRLLALAEGIIGDGPITEALVSCVDNVAEKTGETAALCALSGPETVLVQVRESRSPIRYFAWVGQRVPSHATSCGRALLSMVSQRERRRILKHCAFTQYAPHSLMSIEEVEADIERSISRGWFLNDNGFEPDLVGVAIPMPVENRLFCLMVASPAYRGRERIPEFVDVLNTEIMTYQRRADSAAGNVRGDEGAGRG